MYRTVTEQLQSAQFAQYEIGDRKINVIIQIIYYYKKKEKNINMGNCILFLCVLLTFVFSPIHFEFDLSICPILRNKVQVAASA